VYSDSEVVVRQISESYTCRSAVLRDIYNACKGLINDFQDFTITHVRRENNIDADRLANQAIDRVRREKRPVSSDPAEWPPLEGTITRAPERLVGPRRLLPLEQPG
jgi:hypothetical protein